MVDLILMVVVKMVQYRLEGGEQRPVALQLLDSFHLLLVVAKTVQHCLEDVEQPLVAS